MRFKQPGKSSRGSVPGTRTRERARRRKDDGGSPTRRLKRSLKLPRLENPTSMQTSVTDSPPIARRRLARSRRDWMRSWWGVSPKSASN